MFPHVFGAAAGDSKAVERKDKLDLLFQSIIRGIRPINVLAAGISEALKKKERRWRPPTG